MRIRGNMFEDIVKEHKVHLPSIVGKGYKTFFEFEGRYAIVKGGRGSKKSTTTALKIVYKMMQQFHKYGNMPSTLVIRRFYNTHRDSTYAQLRWAIKTLGVEHLWKSTVSPMEMTYIPSGQKILFRGMDDPMSITSIVVETGQLCWVWWEEFYQITNEEDFDKIDMSIRGELPPHLYKQHMGVMNPWSDKTWIKARFFDGADKNGLKDDGDVLAITRNYDCNEFLGEDDVKIFETMKVKNPRRYNIEGLGNWGVSEGLVFMNMRADDSDVPFDADELYAMRDNKGKRVFELRLGLDFGFTNDPTAFTAMLVDEKNYRIFIFDEFYEYGMSNRAIFNKVRDKGFKNDVIWADSADPRTIAELRAMGLRGIKGVKKVKGEGNKGYIENTINTLQDYDIIVHPRCENVLIEQSLYAYKTNNVTGKLTNEPIDEFNHAMDSIRYGTSGIRNRAFSFTPDGKN